MKHWITTVVTSCDCPVDSERLKRLGLQHVPWDGTTPLPHLLQEAGCGLEGAVLVAAAAGSGQHTGLPVVQQQQLEAMTPPGKGDLTTPLLQSVCQLNLTRTQQQQQPQGQDQEQQHQQQEGQQQQQVPGDPKLSLLVVGYAMKASREQQLAQAGLLSAAPAGAQDALLTTTHTGSSAAINSSPAQQEQQQWVCFMPLDLEVPLEQQPGFHVLLHKGSDELVEVGPQQKEQQQQQQAAQPQHPAQSSSAHAATATAGSTQPDAVTTAAAAAVQAAAQGSSSTAAAAAAAVAGAGVAWSPRLAALQAWLAARPRLAVVDPFQHTAKVVDRRALQSLLAAALSGTQLPGGVVARPPAAVVVEHWGEDSGWEAVAAAGLRPPFIIKPLAACGVASSHAMALVRGQGGWGRVAGRVAAPALVQEFANHGGVQAKVYVLGQQVFYTSRPSIPDICCQPAADAEDQVLLFDSLASLPTQLPSSWRAPVGVGAAAAATGDEAPVCLEVLRPIAACLRQHLQLALFGFDVVVAAGEYVVVDANYFPNYRGGGPAAAAWFRDVMRQAHSQRHPP